MGRTLIKLLKETKDPIVLAVAVHDLGQYVKHYERGKKYVSPTYSLMFAQEIRERRAVTDLGGKTRAMELMTHENPDVRYRALMAVQLLVSQPWVTI